MKSLANRTLAALVTAALAIACPLAAQAADISRGWKVLRGALGDVVPAANAKWVDLETSRSRAYRLANFYETGMPIWLERTIQIPANGASGYWIVSVPNRLMIDRALVNGQPVTDVAAIQANKEMMTPETRAIYAADPYKTQVYDMGISVRRSRAIVAQRWDVPALLLIDGTTLKPGANRLLIQGHDYDFHGELLGKVDLRRPTISDRVYPFAYAVPEGDFSTTTIAGVRPRVPGPYTLKADIEVQDYLGAVLRRETRTVQVKGTTDEQFTLEQKDPREYKAIVTYAFGAEKLRPYWVYLQPRLEKRATRTSFSLEGSDWTMKPVKTDAPPSFPFDNSDSRPTHVPATQRGTWEWYQYDVRQLMLRKTFKLPAELRGQRLLLSVEEVRQTGEFFINGQSAGRIGFNAAPAELDVTRLVKAEGENEIVIALGDAALFADLAKLTTAKKSVSEGWNRRPLAIGTIKINTAPEVRVLRTLITTSVANKKLSVKTFVQNSSAQAATVDVGGEVLLKDKAVLSLPTKSVTVPAGQTISLSTEKAWANPQFWSPWSPTLHGLQTTLRRGGQVLDEKLDRFGFREITAKGDQFYLNGKIFHGLGHEPIYNNEFWPMLDFNQFADRTRQIRELGYTYTRTSNPQVYDEIGLTMNSWYGPSDNGQGDVGSDQETVDLYAKESQVGVPERFNHPSILFHNYGNEIYIGGNKNEKLASSLYEAVNRIRSLDDTRLMMTQGSDDLNGRAEMMSAHYWSHVYLGIPLTQVPQELQQRTTGFAKANWDRSKPLNIDEFSWILPRYGYPWYGEGAMKQTPFRQPDYRPDRLHDIYPTIDRREREFHHFRRSQTAAFAAFAPQLVTNENIKPVLALFFQENTRFWAGRPISRIIDVLNDSGRDATVEVALQLTSNGKTTTAWTQKFVMPQGDAKTVTATVPAIRADRLSNVRAELVSRINGVEQSRRVQKWEIFPKSWAGDVRNVKVGLFDPRGSAKGLFEFLGVKPVSVTNISTLSKLGLDVLVVGEDLESTDVAASPTAVREWANDGGQVLVLRQKKPGDWLPVALTAKPDAWSFETFLYSVGNPLVKGLLPEDFWRWGNAELVTGMAYEPPKNGTVRVLAGKLPTDATLMEALYGKGRFVISALELTSNKIAQEPATARLLANVLREAKAATTSATVTEATKPVVAKPVVATMTSAQVAPSASTYSARAKTLVLFGAEGARVEALRDRLRLQADFATQAPASLAPYGLVVFTDFDGAAEPASDLAPRLKTWVSNGGTLVVQNVTPALEQWLSGALGVSFKRNPITAVRAYKTTHDPVLDGISDGDIAWRGISGEHPFINRGASEHDIIREEVVPEGARVLTYPAVLAKKLIGKGHLVIDQSRWAEVSNKGGEEWGLDSKIIAARYQTALLMNLGAYFDYPEPKANNLVGLSFEPLNLDKYFNRSRLDETAGDNKGWIDLGTRFDLDPLESGLQRMGGVPFVIADEAKTGGNSVIMLRTGERYREMPVETGIIPVGKKARILFFLHTTAWASDKKGTTAWEYEIRYEGHSKLIPGSNFAPFTAVVSVQQEVDVADWLGRPLIPSAWTFKHTEGDMNLYMQRWDNPRPDTPIESIVIRSKLQAEAPLILGITLASDAQNLISGDFSKAAPFSLRLKNFDVLEKKGDLPAGWSANAWHNSSIAEVFSGKEPATGESALGLRNIEGRASLQFYLNPGVPIQAGKSYTVAFKYLAAGQTEGLFFFQPKDVKVKTDIPAETEIALSKTGNVWKQFSGTFTVTEGNGNLVLNYQNRSPGTNDVLYLRDIMVTES